MFTPEFPHGNIATWMCLYSVLLTIMTWAKYYSIDFAFVSDTTVPVQSRIEALKNTYDLWKMLTLALTAGYLTVVVTWITEILKNNSGNFVVSRNEIFLVNQISIAGVALFSICVLVGAGKEFFEKTASITREFSNIRE